MSHATIITADRIPLIAEAAGLSDFAVRSWQQRGRIPAEHWPTITRLGFATFEQLALNVPPRKRSAAA